MTIHTLLAWSAHLFTATGAVCCLFALEATYASDFRTALAWLLLAVVIDAVDGSFARLVRVKTVLPGFDGTLLDNLIDYLNYVVVPALIIHHANILPPSTSMWAASLICIASSYQFCQSEAKTADHYFKGFPSYWNIVAFYLLAMEFEPQINLAIVILLAILIFIPVKYMYLSRNVRRQKFALALTIVWAMVSTVILWQLPSPNHWLVLASLVYVVYYFGASFYLSFRG